MDWLTFVQYAIPVVSIILLAGKRVMRVRYSLTCWLILLTTDKILLPLVPVVPAWPPVLTSLYLKSYLGTVLVVSFTLILLAWVFWRSQIHRWEDSYPRGTLVDYAPWLESKPPATIREIIAFIKD